MAESVSTESVVFVPLTKGMVAVVDAADFDLVSQFVWHATDHDRTNYAASSANRRSGGKAIYMHRLIAGSGPDDHTDHRDGDGLNNRRSNLRTCTNAQNRRNMRKFRGVSKYKGVARCRTNAKRIWEAYIWFENRKIGLGAYPTQEEAARAYNAAALKWHKEFALLNVIEGLTYEESIAPPERNRKVGRPQSHQGT